MSDDLSRWHTAPRREAAISLDQRLDPVMIGFRIDHLLLSPELADRMTAAGVDKDYRGREKSSDHTPVWVELRD